MSIVQAAIDVSDAEHKLALARDHFKRAIRENSSVYTQQEMADMADQGGHRVSRQRISQILKEDK